MKHIKLLKSLIMAAPVLALASPLIILSNTGCGNPESGGASANGSNWVGRTGGTLSYTVNDNDHTYTITGNDNFTADDTFTIPDSVTVNNKEYSVTTIGAQAFMNCTGLTAVDFGGVTTISNFAFRDCTGLTNINLRNVTQIGESVFFGCPFEQISVDLDNSVYKLVGTTEGGFIRRKNDPVNIVKAACGQTGGIAWGDITMPGSVTAIDDNAFFGCVGLTGADPAAATTIGSNAFMGAGLTKINLRNVTTISQEAFYGCPLERIYINNGNSVFELVGSTTNCYIKKKSDNATISPICGNSGGIACGNITFSGSVTAIGNNAFRGCAGFTKVDFGSVTTIGNSAFYRCEGLNEVDLSGVINLGRDWCYDCLNLSSVTIGTQTYNSSDDGWEQVGPDTDCILYAPNETVADAFKTDVITDEYADKWIYLPIQ